MSPDSLIHDPRREGLVLPYNGILPKLGRDVFVAPGTIIVGNVEIGDDASLWYNTVVRADVHEVRIGARTNLQDGTVVHVTGGRFGTYIGNDILIGHQCVIHGCTIHDRAFIGMRALILDGAVIESDSMVAAGAVVTPGKVVPTGELWAGAPAKKMRDLSPEEIERHKVATAGYVRNAKEHRAALG
jgi:carbonic anhydrase/acetyltransferase-like protein (isoleucine patch superfamily)